MCHYFFVAKKYLIYYFHLQVLNEIDELTKGLSNITINRYRYQALGNYIMFLIYIHVSLLQDDVKKRKIISKEDSKDKEPEEGECSESEKDDISDEITPDISTNSESDCEEEAGLLFLTFISLIRHFSIICNKIHTKD